MKLVIGNQKSYLDSKSVCEFIDKLTSIKNHNNVLICPSSIYIDRFHKTGFLIGCQNVSKYASGANTGELSSEQLKSIGVSFCLVGHSEIRKNANETIEDTNIKIQNLIGDKIVPILCVGESLEEREKGIYEEVVIDEIKGALKNIPSLAIEKLMIAYEPIWSIGTGVIPNNSEIEEMVTIIKNYFQDNYGLPGIVLYGGSVNASNIDELNKVSQIDGYLIGGASTKIDEFINIINKCQ